MGELSSNIFIIKEPYTKLLSYLKTTTKPASNDDFVTAPNWTVAIGFCYGRRNDCTDEELYWWLLLSTLTGDIT